MNQQGLSTWIQTQESLKRFIMRHTKDSELAADITQEVFLKVYSNMNQLREPEKLKSWIYQVAKNSITDHYRKLSTRKVPIELDLEREGSALNACAEQCLQELLFTLPEKYRVALELAEMKGSSQIELSKKLNISYSGAKSRVQRARQMLRDLVDEKYQIETDRYGNVIVCEDKIPYRCPSPSDSCK